MKFRVGNKYVSVFVFKYTENHVFVFIFVVLKIFIFVFDHCIWVYLVTEIAEVTSQVKNIDSIKVQVCLGKRVVSIEYNVEILH